MKYIENYNTNESVNKSTTETYNQSGQITTNSKDIIYAKYQSIDLNNKTQNKFFVLTSNGNLFNPIGIDSHRINTVRKELKATSKQTFDYYLKYLQTKNVIFLRRAERSFING